MKTSANKTKRIEVRLSEEDYYLFKLSAVSIGQNPSTVVRMFIDTTINTLKIKVKKGEVNLEDLKALLDD